MKASERLAAIEQALTTLLERNGVAPPAPQPKFMGLADAAVYAGLSVKSIRAMIRRGDLQPYRPVRGKFLVEREALVAAIMATAGRKVRTGRGIRRVVK